MKRLAITLFLGLLGIAVISSSVNAAFVYDITRFKQENLSYPSAFIDEFDDNVPPPAGPLSGSDYQIYPGAAFDPSRESGGLLELNSADAVMEYDGNWIGAVAVGNPNSFFTPFTDGQTIGTFEVNDGWWPDSYFGVSIFNNNLEEETAYMGIYTDPLGNKFAEWGDSFNHGSQDFTTAIGANTTFKFKLLVNASDNTVDAIFDWGNNGNDFTESGITTLIFGRGTTYTGGFDAGESAIPIPTSVLLLGSGLMGVVAFRRKAKK